MKIEKVVADSSFYIAFIDDIDKPSYLILFLEKFNFLMGQKIHSEIRKSKNYSKIAEKIKSEVNFVEIDFEYGELLKPLFSKKQLEKGESEAIMIAYILHDNDETFILILDDHDPRRFIERNLPQLLRYRTGTAGFIKKCTCEFGLLKKHTGISLLKLLYKSKFKIKHETIINLIGEIKRC